MYISIGQSGIFVTNFSASDVSRYDNHCSFFYRVLQFIAGETVKSGLYRTTEEAVSYRSILSNLQNIAESHYKFNAGKLSFSLEQYGWAFYGDGSVFFDDRTYVSYKGRYFGQFVVFDTFVYDGLEYNVDRNAPIRPQDVGEYLFTRIMPN